MSHESVRSKVQPGDSSPHAATPEAAASNPRGARPVLAGLLALTLTLMLMLITISSARAQIYLNGVLAYQAGGDGSNTGGAGEYDTFSPTPNFKLSINGQGTDISIPLALGDNNFTFSNSYGFGQAGLGLFIGTANTPYPGPFASLPNLAVYGNGPSVPAAGTLIATYGQYSGDAAYSGATSFIGGGYAVSVTGYTYDGFSAGTFRLTVSAVCADQLLPATGSGFNGWVAAFTSWDPDGAGPQPELLVAGGAFTSVDGVPANRVAAWDGTSWQPLGAGIEGDMDGELAVYCLSVHDGELIAGGTFTTAGGIPASCIARWNGTLWQPLGTGMPPISSQYAAVVHDLATYNGFLYATGQFHSAGGNTAYSIARWDGTFWSPVGTGLQDGIWVYTGVSLTTWDGKLVVAGYIEKIGTTVVNHIAWTDGVSWNAFGTGMSEGGYVPGASVYSLAEFNGELFAGGYFTTAGGASVSHIARWTGSSWQPLGSGVDYEVYALAAFDTRLVVGGYFSLAGGSAANNIAEWNGAAWETLGAGAGGGVNTLVRYGDQLAVGGDFTTAGGQPAGHWALLEHGLTPSITQQPVNVAVCQNGSGLVSVEATGSSLTYQWRKNGVSVPGATQFVLGFYPAQPSDSGSYDCIVSNVCGSTTSTAATVTVTAGPVITQQPSVPSLVCEGSSVTLDVVATGAAGYQWFMNANAIPGATQPSMVLTNIQPSDTGVYSCVVSGATCSTTTDFVYLLVTPLPAIAMQPADVTVCNNPTQPSPIYFNCGPAGGQVGLTFQWRKDGTPLNDGVTAWGSYIGGTHGVTMYITNPYAPENAGIYDCVLVNPCGTLTSDPAQLIVLCPADYNCDGFVSGDDFDYYIELFYYGHPEADFNHDGFVSGDDFDALAAAFEAGC